jgi:hypothetical protein
MGREKQGRLMRAAVILTTAASLSITSLAIWKLGPDMDGCNAQEQRPNTFIRMSVGGALRREVRRNLKALTSQMPFSGDVVLSITIKVNSSGTLEIEMAKAKRAGSSDNPHDVTGKVQDIIQIKNMRRFSDSNYYTRERFDIILHKG